MKAAEIVRGDGPVVVAVPHAAPWLPEEVAARLNETGRALADADWRVDRLYEGLLAGATLVRATFHRYLIDANRDPSGASLYPGRNTTGLVPLTDFDGRPIWREPPTQAEVATRRDRFHAPYHAALAAEVARAKARWGVAVLYDAHSIRSRIPFLFEGTLPDFNIGDAEGRACAPVVVAALREVCEAAEGFATVTNGRFKGGWTTRAYGRPAEGVHAVQMELAQSSYLEAEAPPWAFSEAKAARLRPTLAECLARLDRLARSGALA